nr:glycosyltransferase family 4 protein [Dyella sp. ASV24]
MLEAVPATRSDDLDVALLPKIDLHTGYHPTLINTPPAGHRVQPANASHVFLFPEQVGFPHERFHLGEFVEVEGNVDLVHAARWPVLGAGAWVVDMDDLLYPVLCGRTAIDAGLRVKMRERADKDFLAQLELRVANMLTAYAHPSCAAILLWGHPRDSIVAAADWFASLNCNRLGNAFLEKVVPIRPAKAAYDPSLISAKWAGQQALRVVFCGRDFDCKNGLMALRVMQRVRAVVPTIECVFIGPVPDEIQQQQPGLLDGISHRSSLGHDECVEMISLAHLLFHPSKYESMGLVFIEAMAAGAAVLTARGDRMDYVDELFASGGAILVDRDEVPAEAEEAAFERGLLSLATNFQLAKEMGLRNYSLVAHGEYAISERDKVLTRVYETARAGRCPPLTLDDLPHVRRGGVLRLPSSKVQADELRYRSTHADCALNVYI